MALMKEDTLYGTVPRIFDKEPHTWERFLDAAFPADEKKP